MNLKYFEIFIIRFICIYKLKLFLDQNDSSFDKLSPVALKALTYILEKIQKCVLKSFKIGLTVRTQNEGS